MFDPWQEKDILITVKTYPELSTKYTETVCIAGILAEPRQMIRLYPFRYRYLDGTSQFSKYQWIKAKIRKTVADSRPESFNIDDASIKLGPIIPSSRDWAEREKWVLSCPNVFDSIETVSIKLCN